MIDIGYLIGAIVAAIFVLAGIVAIVLGVASVRMSRGESGYQAGDDRFIGRMVYAGGIAAIVITLAIWLPVNWPPFSMQYHTYKPVSGTVQTVETRLLAEDHGSTQYYVLKFQGDDTAYRCDDSRCSLLKPGVTVHLQCEREWQYASTPGWTCHYDQEG